MLYTLLACTNMECVQSCSNRSGIIIDGFGELRDKENEAKEYREETCVVCGVNRQTMDQVHICLCLHFSCVKYLCSWRMKMEMQGAGLRAWQFDVHKDAQAVAICRESGRGKCWHGMVWCAGVSRKFPEARGGRTESSSLRVSHVASGAARSECRHASRSLRARAGMRWLHRFLACLIKWMTAEITQKVPFKHSQFFCFIRMQPRPHHEDALQHSNEPCLQQQRIAKWLTAVFRGFSPPSTGFYVFGNDLQLLSEWRLSCKWQHPCAHNTYWCPITVAVISQ